MATKKKSTSKSKSPASKSSTKKHDYPDVPDRASLKSYDIGIEQRPDGVKSHTVLYLIIIVVMTAMAFAVLAN